ncbi:unnamed protein product [Ranitomeya imitator]|uniref:Helix-turn-helix domain-containing protein n=1 Tax=Ranitomeya imitator TaxID=111125 RepID=A0ABN9M450_9NEOB|nr:unnamed protein product [Ranitomeya imitator]
MDPKSYCTMCPEYADTPYVGDEFKQCEDEFILRRNFLLFGDEFFLQLRGTAMGSNVAPTYANIYMAVLEDEFVYNSSLWRHGTSLELEAFHGFLNQIYSELQFTLTQSTIQIQFLDTLVYKAGNKLETDIFIKTTDRNGLLAFDSNYPRKMVGSLPWSQLLRVRRIVSDEERVDSRLNEMCNKFISRGYPAREVIKYKNKANSCSRLSIRNKTRVESTTDRIPFVSTYNSASSRVGNILRRHWSLLQRGLPFVPKFEAPPMMSFRRGRNFRDKLVKSDIGTSKRSIQSTLSTDKNGNFPCLGCSCCNNMLKGEFFHHPHTGKKIFLKERYTCTSSFVVYMIVCPCGLTYVGETTMEVRARITKHKSTVRTGLTELPVPKHFIDNKHSVNQLRFRVIDSVPVLRREGNRLQILKTKELRWIYTLGLLQPKGLNIDFNLHIEGLQ